MRSNKITDMSPVVLEHIFSYLDYQDVVRASDVCKQFHISAGRCVRRGVAKLLKDLWIKSNILFGYLQICERPIETKIELNRTYSAIEMLKANIHATYVLSRHYLNNDNMCLPLGNILDELNFHLDKMTLSTCSFWPEECAMLQNILSKSLYQNTAIVYNKRYEFAVQVVDILDFLLGVNYEISCSYNLKHDICRTTAYYYTDNIKFLSYLPDFSFLSDCQGRQITFEEEERILRYLLLLAHLHNNMHCRSKEYIRELLLKSRETCIGQRVSGESHELHRQHSSRVIEGETVKETYKRYLQENEDGIKKGLLNCEIILECDLSEAPYEIMKSYDVLLKDLMMSDESVAVDMDDRLCNYGAKIKLQLAVQQKNTEYYEVLLQDGMPIYEETDVN